MFEEIITFEQKINNGIKSRAHSRLFDGAESGD